MKKALVVALLLVSFSAHAAVLAALVKSEYVSTVTGKMKWKCTYNVMGQYTSVLLDSICPPTMNFE